VVTQVTAEMGFTFAEELAQPSSFHHLKLPYDMGLVIQP
jgi:hypothetical protein